MSRLAIAALLAAAISLGGGALHPFGDVKRAGAIIEGPPADAETRAILERSCASCHSEQVRWPWYSNLAPASWLLEHDVSQARSRMNLSRWNSYSTQQQEELLAAMGAAVRTQEMPPRRFTIMHPEAALTPAQRQKVYQSSREQRRTLKTRR